MQKVQYVIILLATMLCAVGCDLIDIDNILLKINTSKEIDTLIISNDSPEAVIMRKRARQMAYIQWMPLDSIPNRVGVYPAGHMQMGIPYSSVKEKDKFVGQEVSFHTFMTAVNNPRSVLYTERTNAFPYKGVNCGAYYGTVCSMAVNYALGIEVPYQSDMYEMLPDFARITPQSPYNVSTGDILLSPGHVVLVIETKCDSNGDPATITILESAGSTFIKEYSIDEFKQRWERVGWKSMRYLGIKNNIDYTPLPFIAIDGEVLPEFKYNNDLCPSRGDRACYRFGEDVIINIFDSPFNELELYRNENLLSTCQARRMTDLKFQDLQPGVYKARLISNNCASDYVEFEIIDTNVDVKFLSKQSTVSFKSDNAAPEYIVVGEEDGFRNDIYLLTHEEKVMGNKRIRSLKSGEFVKVFFRGQYGRVSNIPIPID